MYTGSYHFPVVTITGSVKSDIVCCEQVIGVGELAISDHRGSFPDIHDLARVCEQARCA
jgi:beta-aspartyl-dipeptidase (metallo-type)